MPQKHNLMRTKQDAKSLAKILFCKKKYQKINKKILFLGKN